MPFTLTVWQADVVAPTTIAAESVEYLEEIRRVRYPRAMRIR